jgi:shikimate kinase
MKKYKIVLIGSQCCGKSSLISYLQENTGLNCIDLDEEIKKRHGDQYPKDHQYATNEVQPDIENRVMEMDSVIYSASFWGLGKDRKIHDEKIEEARNRGCSFVLLKTNREVLEKRNTDRMSEASYDDASKSFDWYLSVYNDMKKKGYFDLEIDTNQPIEKVAEKLLEFIKF